MDHSSSRSAEKALVARALNRLLCLAVDSSGGYALAAGYAKDAGLREAFWHAAEERSSFVRDLQTEVDALGSYPATEGTALAELHRTFVTVHHALLDASDEVLVRACIFGDLYAEQAYREVLARAPWTGRGGAHATVTAELERIEATRKAITAFLPVGR